MLLGNIVMPYHPDHHHRQSIRLRDFDYARGGGYFVTLCAWQRECLFGDVLDGGMRLNEFGVVVGECWAAVPEHFPHVQLDAFLVMPNHVHGILIIDDRHPVVGATHGSPEPDGITEPNGLRFSENVHLVTRTRATHASPLHPTGPKRGSLGAIVGQFKSAVTKRINTMRDNPGCPVWQRNYHEHVIRDERDLYAIRQYIADNPAKWALDDNHPTRL